MVLFAYNPRSGHGQSRRAAETLSWAVRGAGHEAVLVAVGDETAAANLPEALAKADALVVCGGDGTLHHLLGPLIAARTPVYHVPTGTENLFAREFGSDRAPARLLGALSARRTSACDVGEAEIDGALARPFVLMCSIGPDAEATRRVAAARAAGRGLPGKLGFVGPALGQVLRPALPRITVRVDGDEVVRDEQGLLVVANSRQYALRIDPAARASMADGLLDAVFFPSASSLGTISWLVRARLRAHLARPRLVYRAGAQIEVACAPGEDMPVQLDGEAVAQRARSLRLRVRPGALRVLAE